MKKYLFLIIGILIFAVSLSAQTKHQEKTNHPSKDTILYEVLKDLANENVCDAKSDASEVYSGTIVKREFAEDEMRLSGFVLRMEKDNRLFINLDYGERRRSSFFENIRIRIQFR